MTSPEMTSRLNVLLRRVDGPNAERIIEAIHAALPKPTPEGKEPDPVRMEDAVAAISFVLAVIIMAAPEKQRAYMPGIIGALIDMNMASAKIVEAVNAAAAAEPEKPAPQIIIPKSGDVG